MTLPRWLHYAAAALLLSAVYFSGLASVRMHNNESAWIGTSYYFEAFLGDDVRAARPDLPPDVWAEGFWTLTQPPLTLYVIGIGRRLGGLSIADLNEPWIHGDGRNARDVPAQNPSARLLLWSRRPMALLSVMTGLMLFFIVARCSGFVAAYAFIALFSTNPFLLETLRRAMGDAVVTVFGVAAIVAAILGLDSAARGADGAAPRGLLARATLWAAAAGVCCGLSGAAKLNGLSGAFGVTAVAALVVVLVNRASAAAAPASRLPIAPSRVARWPAAAGAAAIVLAAAAIAFVAPSPFLQRDPVRGMRKMLEHRVEGASRQRAINTAYPVDGIVGGVKATAYRVLFKPAPLRFPGGWVLAATFMLVGFGALARNALRGVTARAPNAAFALILVGASQTIPSILSPLDWDRYYLFPTLFANVCLAIGFAFIAARIVRRLRPR